MEAKGVRSINQLLSVLYASSREIQTTIGPTANHVKRNIVRDKKHDFTVIEPPHFIGVFRAGQVIVCLPEQRRLFWRCMSWVRDHIFYNLEGRCMYTDEACEDLLLRMPRHMASLFNHMPTQLRFSIFAASNRPEYFQITRGYPRPLWIEVTTESNRSSLQDITNHRVCSPRRKRQLSRSERSGSVMNEIGTKKGKVASQNRETNLYLFSALKRLQVRFA